ncbi:M14 family zinc carboxypeptidase [Marinicauda pacifica]|jgi:cytosolic carboxypeptidase protein 6|uniref:M14 family zinc carboxypeptidase n=1 Tax=Marinicauda pacifica TaxID=1133559 RepID=UPI0035C7CA0D
MIPDVLKQASGALALGAAAFSVSACTTVPAGNTGVRASADTKAALCQTGGVTVLGLFETAGRHHCTVTGPGAVTLSVDPEAAAAGPINPSPWYRFELEAERGTGFAVTLDYGDYRHRYNPLIEHDGDMAPLDEARVLREEPGNRVTLSLALDAGTTLVSGRNARTPDQIAAWSEAFARDHGFESIEYGRSAQGRVLEALVAGNEREDTLIVAVTRQHPPEVSGAQAFEAFAERLAGQGGGRDARILLIPLANPDGVAGGHWRHGARGVDLNRDWYTAEQPAVSAAQALIEAEAEGRDQILFFDFHSTNRTVIYSPPDDYAGRGADFLAQLRALYAAELSNPPPWEGAHNPGKGTSKGWAISVLEAPGLTVELADHAESPEIEAVGTLTADAALSYARSR